MRVLDLDLDFFLCGTAHYVDSADQPPDADENPPWLFDIAITFLAERCLLKRRRPGFVVEHHNELFYRWGEAFEAGQMSKPLEVVHVDAHADLGLGDSSYIYLMRELAFEPIETRYEILRGRRPDSRSEMLDLGNYALTDGNWLMFALACGWLSNLTYVTNSCAEASDGARPGDLMYVLMQDFDLQAEDLQLSAPARTSCRTAGAAPRSLITATRPFHLQPTCGASTKPLSRSTSCASPDLRSTRPQTQTRSSTPLWSASSTRPRSIRTLISGNQKGSLDPTCVGLRLFASPGRQ